MPTFAVPGFLLAGALAALVPLALHLIRRRPPGRAPLPTARFLSEDPRNAVRVSRPTDVPLLVLRMLLLLLLGAALARPAWVPAPRGTSTVVLLDRGASMAGAGWAAGIGAARRALLAEDGAARGGLVLFDTAATRIPRARVTAALFDSLLAAGPSSVDADYAAALRALPAAARELRGADSVRAGLVSSLRAGGWTPGLAPLRRAAWPGALDLTLVPAASSAGSTAGDAGDADRPARRARVIAGEGGAYLSAAMGAVGYDVGTGTSADTDADVYVVAAPVDAAAASALVRRARAGATLVVAAGAVAGPLRDVLPWRGAVDPSDDDAGGALWFGPELALTGAAGRALGTASDSARVLAAWEDGRAAAAAHRVGEGCAVFAATPLEGGELPLQAAYPAALRRLARGCASPEAASADATLDAGGIALLRGRGPAAVPAGDVGAAEAGIPLGRWLLAAALLVALIETFLAYRRRSA